jgi:hypothetical protein
LRRMRRTDTGKSPEGYRLQILFALPDGIGKKFKITAGRAFCP